MKSQQVRAECVSCRGTGLYQGFCEAEDEAVICLSCDGTGCQTITYKPFVRRKKRLGVKRISRSRGTFIATGVGPTGTSMTYAEFSNGSWRRQRP